MALTGFLNGNTCYSTSAEALDAHFNAIPSTILTNGNTVYFQKNNVSLAWQRVEISPLNVVTLSTVPVPSLQPCDTMLGFNDGLAFALIVVGVMFAAVTAGIISKAR